MKKIFFIGTLIVFSNISYARDSVAQFSVKDLLATGKAKSALTDIPLYFGNSKTPKVNEKYDN